MNREIMSGYLPPALEHAINNIMGTIESSIEHKGRSQNEKEYICKMEKTIRAALSLYEQNQHTIKELVAALEWVGGHAYSGGKSFKDLPIVKEALAKAMATS